MEKNDIADAFEKALKKLKEDASEKKRREGEETLKRTLREMYEAYRDKKSPKPDYEEKYPARETPVLDAKDYRSGYDLRAAAETAAREKYAQKRETAAKTSSEIADKAAEQKKEAYRGYRDEYRAAGERDRIAKRRAAEKIASNGVGNSTVAEAVARAAERTGEAIRSNADEKYRNAVSDLGERIEAAEKTYRAAIRNFDLAEAAETEKTLFRLKKERDAALRATGTVYEDSLETTKSENAARAKRIAADEAARDLSFRQSPEEKAGQPYGDEEAGEMENRYRIAESYYASLPKEIAAKLFAASEDELKFLLGSYYRKLKESINRN